MCVNSTLNKHQFNTYSLLSSLSACCCHTNRKTEEEKKLYLSLNLSPCVFVVRKRHKKKKKQLPRASGQLLAESHEIPHDAFTHMDVNHMMVF